VREVRLQNQWKFFIQKNLNNISLDLLNGDKEKNYLVDPREMMRVIERRIRIPDYLKQSEDLLIKSIVNYQDEGSGKIRYKEFVEDLKNFNFEYQNQDHRIEKQIT